MSRIYVSRLPAEMNNQEALNDLLVQRTGVVPKNIINRPNYALIDLPEELTVEKAVELLNGYEIMGSQLLVEPSQNRRGRGTYIQITNIPEQYPWDDFTTFLSNFGNFQYLEKGPSRQNGYSALVTYENQEQAQQAHIQLNNCEIQPGSFLKASPPMDRRPPRRSGPFPRPLGPPYKPNEFPVRILVLSDMVGAIIGRAGGTIRQITQQSRARVDVHRKENAGSPEKVITIYGAPENCSTACLKIMEIMQQEANATNRGEIPLKLLAHNALIGRIIGKSGNVIKRIMETSETKIAVSSNIHDCNSWNLERVITIKGRVENMHKAERMISSKLRQNYEFDMNCVTRAPQYLYPGALNPMAAMMAPRPTSPYGPSPFHHPPPPPMGSPGGPDMHHQKETVYVYVPHTSVGAIIGTGGSNIREMISCSGASIKVTQPNKDDPAEKLTERKVCIVGTPDAQWKAQFMIFKRIAFEGFHGPQEAPLKVEIGVPTNQVGRIIGKGGATVRELQRLTHASIKFPEDGRNSELEETAVHIVGEFFSAMAAQRQIRSLIIRSNNFHLRRQQQQSPLQQSN